MSPPLLDAEAYRLLFLACPDVLLVLAPDAPRYTMVAATAARFAATHTTADSLGRGLFEVFPDNPDDPAADGLRNLRRSLDRVLLTRAPDSMPVQRYDVRREVGGFETRFWSPRNLPVLDESGAVRLILHRVEDVTELVRSAESRDELVDRNHQMEREVLLRSREVAAANEELRAVNVRLGELDQAKTTFFSNVSHELRTPLTLMLGPLEDLRAEPEVVARPPLAERVDLAWRNALRLLRLVNAILDFSRAEAGRMTARFAPVSFAEVTAELVGMFQSAVSRAGLRLTLSIEVGDEPAWIDRDLWERIIPNLISNALKFTPEGEISVRLFTEGPEFVLEVRDTGVGIPAVDLDRVFERFHRVEGQQGRSHEGAGIGLALVRELVRLHGGDITVESEVGVGTCFRITLPRGCGHLPAARVSETAGPGLSSARRDARTSAAEAEGWSAAGPANPVALAQPSGAASAGGRRAHVLVVDDNADLRRYLSELLSDEFEVTLAVDGQDALEQVRERLPDLVLSDVMMPRLDGFGLLAALRGGAAPITLPVILLSARAGEESSVEGLDAGADDYLLKPFTARELRARVRTHAGLAATRRRCLEALERANAELDAFSYSVSHDLRAPLRSIAGFSEALEEDCADHLDDAGRDHLRRIRGAVGRMATLIDDLIGLARVTRTTLRPTPVDLTALVLSIGRDLAAAHPTRVVDLIVEPDLTVVADAGLLRVALTNLMGNAWKYSARRAHAHVTVGLTDGVCFVRDDGAGFDMAYAGRLFTPFQRLHSPIDFEGTGIGLATVRRVVALHEGRVWGEGAPDQGATFYFTLSAA